MRRRLSVINALIVMALLPPMPLSRTALADCEEPSTDACTAVVASFSADAEGHWWELAFPDSGDLTVILDNPTGEYRLYVYLVDEDRLERAQPVAAGVLVLEIPEAPAGTYEVWVNSRTGETSAEDYDLAVEWNGSPVALPAATDADAVPTPSAPPSPLASAPAGVPSVAITPAPQAAPAPVAAGASSVP